MSSLSDTTGMHMGVWREEGVGRGGVRKEEMEGGSERGEKREVWRLREEGERKEKGGEGRGREL